MHTEASLLETMEAAEKSEKVVLYPKVAKCTDSVCGLIVFCGKSEKQLSDKQITDLLSTSRTSVIKGFKSKSGKSV
jgi:DNA topoisomerase-3